MRSSFLSFVFLLVSPLIDLFLAAQVVPYPSISLLSHLFNIYKNRERKYTNKACTRTSHTTKTLPHAIILSLLHLLLARAINIQHHLATQFLHPFSTTNLAFLPTYHVLNSSSPSLLCSLPFSLPFLIVAAILFLQFMFNSPPLARRQSPRSPALLLLPPSSPLSRP